MGENEPLTLCRVTAYVEFTSNFNALVKRIGATTAHNLPYNRVAKSEEANYEHSEIGTHIRTRRDLVC